MQESIWKSPWKKKDTCRPPLRVWALKKSKPVSLYSQHLSPTHKRGGKLFYMIWLKHQLHEFAHSTSDRLYYKSFKYVHNCSLSSWGFFFKKCMQTHSRTYMKHLYLYSTEYLTCQVNFHGRDCGQYEECREQIKKSYLRERAMQFMQFVWWWTGNGD